MNLCLSINQVDELLLVVYIQFGVDFLDVGSYGVFGNEQFVGNCNFAAPICELKEDFCFALGELEGFFYARDLGFSVVGG